MVDLTQKKIFCCNMLGFLLEGQLHCVLLQACGHICCQACIRESTQPHTVVRQIRVRVISRFAVQVQGVKYE